MSHSLVKKDASFESLIIIILFQINSNLSRGRLISFFVVEVVIVLALSVFYVKITA